MSYIHGGGAIKRLLSENCEIIFRSAGCYADNDDDDVDENNINDDNHKVIMMTTLMMA